MEKAIHFRAIHNLDRIKIKDIGRFYFGEEFCDRLLPSNQEMKEVVNKARESNKDISLLIPPLSETGLKKAISLINLLDSGSEVIVNDYGALNLVANEFENPIIIGRVMGRNILQALNIFNNDKDLIKENILLFGSRIKGIDVDYFNANKINPILAKILDFSFYRGPFFWTVTRRCAFNSNSQSLHKFAACKKECLKNKAIIKNTLVNKRFLLEGNKIINLEMTARKKINYGLFKRVVYKLKES
ncbi:MAG: hypothetical protein U9R34_05645 [Nanoarchaeota archaeon]|nr:hypothetical protein [Nanoarchaeota archaeon]